MSNLKIELNLDGTNEELVEMTGRLMAALQGAPTSVKQEESVTQDVAKSSTKARSPKTTTASTKEPRKSSTEGKEVPKEEPNEEPNGEVKEEPKTDKGKKTKTSVSLDDVRPLMSAKISTHREQIKAKMTEMGAGNLSSIPEEKLEEFYNFLKGLSDE